MEIKDKTWNQLSKEWFARITSRSFMILIITIVLLCTKIIDLAMFSAVNGFNYFGPAIKDRLTNGVAKVKETPAP